MAKRKDRIGNPTLKLHATVMQLAEAPAASGQSGVGCAGKSSGHAMPKNHRSRFWPSCLLSMPSLIGAAALRISKHGIHHVIIDLTFEVI